MFEGFNTCFVSRTHTHTHGNISKKGTSASNSWCENCPNDETIRVIRDQRWLESPPSCLQQQQYDHVSLIVLSYNNGRSETVCFLNQSETLSEGLSTVICVFFVNWWVELATEGAFFLKIQILSGYSDRRARHICSFTLLPLFKVLC